MNLKYYLTLAIFFLLFTSGICESKKWDSLIMKAEKTYKNEDYLSAFDMFFNLAYEIEKEAPNHPQLGNVYVYLGNCYDYFQYEKEAIIALKKAINVYKKQKNLEGEAFSLCYLGDILEDNEKINEAMKGYNRASEIFNQIKNEKGKAQLFDNIASIYENNNQYDSAFYFLNKALKIYLSEKDSLGIAKVLNNFGDVSRRDGKLELSLKYYQKSLEISKKINSKTTENGNLKDISKTYAKLGLYKNAYNSYTQYHETYQKLKVENKISEIARLQISNMNERKNLQIKEIETNNKLYTLRITFIIIALILSFIIVLLLYITFKTKSKKNEELIFMQQELLKAEIKSSQLEKETLHKELELKKKKLSDFTKVLIDRSEIIEQLKKQLENSLKTDKISDDTRKKTIDDLGEAVILTNQDWNKFKRRFEDVYEGFFEKITTTFPQLTSGDLRLAAVMKLELNKSEIAAMLGISEDSVKKAKQRLKKKLSDDPEFNLNSCIENI